jgi:hypothetical protein
MKHGAASDFRRSRERELIEAAVIGHTSSHQCKVDIFKMSPTPASRKSMKQYVVPVRRLYGRRSPEINSKSCRRTSSTVDARGDRL